MTIEFHEGLAREWSVSAECVSAGGTASGPNTKRSHAILAARHGDLTRVLVHHIEDSLVLRRPDGSERRYPLSSTIYFDSSSPDQKAVHPRGHELIESFSDEAVPTWHFRCDPVKVTRRIRPAPGFDAIMIEYRMEGLSADEEARIEIRPMISGRNSSDLHAENRVLNPRSDPGWLHARFTPYPGVPGLIVAYSGGGRFQEKADWYRRIRLIAEAGAEESLLAPGIFRLPLLRENSSWIWFSTTDVPATVEQAFLMAGIRADELDEAVLLPLIHQLAPLVPDAFLDLRLWWTITLAAALRRGLDVRFAAPSALDAISALLRGHAREAKVGGDGVLEVTAGESSWWERADPSGRPRIGRLVEMEALWLNALASAEIIERVLADGSGETAAVSFRDMFLKTSSGIRNWLRVEPIDVDRDGTALLPAAALRYPLLSPEPCRALLASLSHKCSAPGWIPGADPIRLRLMVDRGEYHEMLARLWKRAAEWPGK